MPHHMTSFFTRTPNKLDYSYIYSMGYLLLSHKKERNWVICRDTDGPREYYTEGSKSEKEKQIRYINAYIWNLEKWYTDDLICKAEIETPM